MATFPALVPSDAPITPGAWPATAHVALNGAEASVRHGSAQIGGRWRARFANVTEANFLAIVAHYTGQRSGFDAFGFDPVTLAADRTPAGCSWLYADMPRVVDHHADLFTVECEFRCELRGLVVVPGAAWRTGATTFTPGARDGGIVYGPLVAWVTAATTFTPGARFDGVSSNAGVSWVTAATTFTPGARTGEADTFLLHMDGSDGSTTFTDSGGSGITVTAYGNAQVSTTDPKYGSGSLLLDGAGDYLQTAASSILQLSTGNFTVECWVYVNSGNSNDGLFTFGDENSGLALAIYQGNWSLCVEGANGVSMGAASTGSWQHVAVTRSGSSLRLFIDGTQKGSTLSDSTDFVDNQLIIGYYYTSDYAINAKVDEFRVKKGTALYTSAFTPPAGPFPDS